MLLEEVVEFSSQFFDALAFHGASFREAAPFAMIKFPEVEASSTIPLGSRDSIQQRLYASAQFFISRSDTIRAISGRKIKPGIPT